MSLRVRPFVLFASLIAAFLVGCARRPAQPAGQLSPDFSLRIQPLGRVSPKVVETVRAALTDVFKARVSVLAPTSIPSRAWYAPRRRWLAEAFVDRSPNQRDLRTFYVTSEDISRPAHGQANYGILGYTNVNAVVSSYRTHGDMNLLHKVAVHEMGHVLGLPHCQDARCVMQDLNGKASTISGSEGFCPACKRKIAPYLRG